MMTLRDGIITEEEDVEPTVTMIEMIKARYNFKVPFDFDVHANDKAADNIRALKGEAKEDPWHYWLKTLKKFNHVD